jgi:hypothetical protein
VYLFLTILLVGVIMNQSKIRDPRFWIKWKNNGAVHDICLKNVAIGTHYSGFAAGYSTLSLGEVVIASGPGWSVTSPVCAIVVPTGKHKVGMYLYRIPKDAISMEAFFEMSRVCSIYNQRLRIKESSQPQNPWYVARGQEGEEEYLHDDGVWRETTEHDGALSGFYATRELAKTSVQNARN